MFRSLILGLSLATSASAQNLPVYDGPVPVTLGATSLVLPIEVTAEAAGEDRLRIHIEADLDGVLPVAAGELRRELDEIPRSCTDRLSLREVLVAAVDGAETGEIEVSVGFRYARWLCEKVFGASVESELFTETATVAARVAPYVAEGRLQLQLTEFRVSELGELAKALNAEVWMRRELQRALDGLNANAGFSQPPGPIWDEGYRYDRVEIVPGDNPVLQVGIAGPDSALALLRIKAALEEDD